MKPPGIGVCSGLRGHLNHKVSKTMPQKKIYFFGGCLYFERYLSDHVPAGDFAAEDEIEAAGAGNV